MEKLKKKNIKSIAIIFVCLAVCFCAYKVHKYVYAAEEYSYRDDTNGIDSGEIYAIIYKSPIGTNDRLLFHTSSSTLTDQVMLDYDSDTQIKLATSFEDTEQLWKITGSNESGWTVQSLDDDKYLSITGAKNSKVDVVSTEQIINIEKSENGTYYLYKEINGNKYYLSHDDSATQFKVSENKVEFSLYKREPKEKALDNMTTLAYFRDEDGVDSDSNYMIVYKSENLANANNRILDHAIKTSTTDQVTGNIKNNQIISSVNVEQNLNNRVWRISGNDEDGYTIRSNSDTRYLNAEETTTEEQRIKVDLNSSKFYFEQRDNGSYYIYTTVDDKKLYIHHQDGIKSAGVVYQYNISEKPSELYLYKETNVNGKIANTKFSGQTEEQPFIHEAVPSDNYRIPAMVTLDNGWIVASGDVRWNDSIDSPSNIDTMVSISKDGGKTWNYEIINYFADYSNDISTKVSASFIDSTLVKFGNGEVILMCDAFPSYVGNNVGAEIGNESTGFDSNNRLLITKVSQRESTPTSLSRYTYYADIYGDGEEYLVEDKKIKLYNIVNSEDNKATELYVDSELNVYYLDNGKMNISYVQQGDTNDFAQKNLFYRSSDYRIYPCSYLYMRKGKVTKDGIDWENGNILNVKTKASENKLVISPGKGFTVKLEDGTERIIFILYDSAEGKLLTSSLYSDDGGKTWNRGEKNTNIGVTVFDSESQIVKISDNAIRMYSRNGYNKIGYADSTDYGVTWGEYKVDDELDYVGNCMVGFTNITGSLIKNDGTVYTNLIFASYPKTYANSNIYDRQQGVVRIGNINADGTVEWLNGADVKYPGHFGYSVITQLKENGKNVNKFGILYENATGSIRFEAPTFEELLDPPEDYTYTDIENVSLYDLTTKVDGIGGTISESIQNIIQDTKEKVAFYHDDEFEIEKVTLDGEDVTDSLKNDTLDVLMNSNHEVIVKYKKAEKTVEEKLYDLTTKIEGNGGTISSSKQKIKENSLEIVTMNPEEKYEIESVLLDGEDVTESIYENKLNVTMDNNHEVVVKYKKIETPDKSEEPINNTDEKEENKKEDNEEKNTVKENNVNTSDHFIFAIVIFAISLSGIVITKSKLTLKKENK